MGSARIAGTNRNPVRTLPVATSFFKRREHRRLVLDLAAKPELFGEGSVTQRAWQSYQSYLTRVRPIQRAEFYKRLLERHDCKSIRALARITGEDWSRVARILKVLELPPPVLDRLRVDDSPATVGYFTEKRLRELAMLRDPGRIWDRFQEMLQNLATEN